MGYPSGASAAKEAKDYKSIGSVLTAQDGLTYWSSHQLSTQGIK